MKLSTLSLDHLGLVAAIFDALGISSVIDELIPKTRDCKLSRSAIIKALIINGLGFVERKLYIFPSYFENLALERLFYPGVRLGDRSATMQRSSHSVHLMDQHSLGICSASSLNTSILIGQISHPVRNCSFLFPSDTRYSRMSDIHGYVDWHYQSPIIAPYFE